MRERPRAEQRLQEHGERRLADEAETDACERDAELADREILVEAPLDVRHDACARVARVHERLDLGRPQLHQGELGEHEERVHEQEASDGVRSCSVE